MPVLRHYHHECAREDLKYELDNFREGHMIFLIGPSGAGKTTLRHAVMREVFGDPMQWGRGRIPAVETFALLPHAAFYSSLATARALHNEVHAPLLSWLFPNPRIDEAEEARIQAELRECRSVWERLRPKRATEDQYWTLLREGVMARGCRLISIDQVTALLVNRKNKEPAHHIIHLMAFAEQAQIMFLMTGVHTASRLWELHSELRRRVHTVWLPPYSHRRKSDELPFLRLLKALSGFYPLSREDLLCVMAYDILAATAGVFAEITQLLDRSAKLAKSEHASSIKKSHIEASYYNQADLASLWSDVNAFEQIMAAADVRDRARLISMGWSGDVGGKA